MSAEKIVSTEAAAAVSSEPAEAAAVSSEPAEAAAVSSNFGTTAKSSSAVKKRTPPKPKPWYEDYAVELMLFSVLVICGLAYGVYSYLFAGSYHLSLTSETWDEAVAGKTVFVKFLAPCNSSTLLITYVDCTIPAGRVLCERYKIRGFPILKYGIPDKLEEYKGGRGLNALRPFAYNLSQTRLCNPINIDACSESQNTQIAEFVAMGMEKREVAMQEQDGDVRKIELAFEEIAQNVGWSHGNATEKKNSAMKILKREMSWLKMLRRMDNKEENVER